MKTLYWVRNDLRLHDNLALRRATFGSETLDFVYSIDRSLATAARHRKAFWFESLWQFQQSLGAYGQFLNLTHLPISEFIDSSNDLTRVVASRSYNFKDQQTEKALQQVCTRHDIELELVDQAPLILAEQLPIDLAKLKSFTPFRKKIESSVSPRDPLPAPESLAPFSLQNSSELQTMGSPSLKLFPAGEKAALARLDHYLWRSKKALTYKETRNGMVEFDDSTKFSPYLAVGSLSPRKIYQELKKFESEIEANESTYWIYFELLWRDFFKYYSLKHGEKLFQLAGPKQTQLDWEVGLQRNRNWHKWTKGQTGQEFVDANMTELRRTGWMSNRGRQNVASYWSKHIYCDWRLGARWFEKQLIDYDAESNWGNWAYNSGVGPDPRDRKFDLVKQAQMYDPDRRYRNKFLA